MIQKALAGKKLILKVTMLRNKLYQEMLQGGLVGEEPSFMVLIILVEKVGILTIKV